MSAQSVRVMLLSVADRFKFGERELWHMPMSRLQFWYDGAVEFYEAERERK